MVQKRSSIPPEKDSLKISSDIKSDLSAIAGWALALSAIGLGLLLIVLLAAGFNSIYLGWLREHQASATISPLLVGMGYLIAGGAVMVPVYAFFQFGHFLKKALSNDDQAAMDKAFAHLKSGLRYAGWMVISGLVVALIWGGSN